MKFLFPLLFLPLSVAVAQPPAKPPTLIDLNKQAVEALRVQHDRGADLYNAGDAGGAVKVYETALGTVSAFLAHQPVIQKTIGDGILDARKADGDKARAFKLHEVVEQVRTDLRAETKKLEAEPKKPDPVAPPAKPKDPPVKPTEPPVKPKVPPVKPKEPMPKDPPVKPTEPPTPKPELSGVITLKGQPLAGADVVIATLNQAEPRVFVTKTGPDGKYAFAKLPTGDYVVVVQSARVPAKYQTTDTSGLRAKITAGGIVNDFDLK